MQKIVLITGASSGIGREFSLLIAKEGHNVALVARSEDKLKQLSDDIRSRFGVEAPVYISDLAQPGQPEKIYRQISKQYDVTHLINNAGFGDLHDFHNSDLSKMQSMIDVNIRALTTLSHVATTDMMSKGEGAILNVASTASFYPGPGMAVYYASKNYVRTFTEALHEELKPHNIKVSALCPGATATHFAQEADMEGRAIFSNSNRLASAKDVAQFGWVQLAKNTPVAVPGFTNKISAQLPRFLPRSIVRRAIRRIQS